MLKGDAAEAAARWTGATEPADPASLADCDVVVDALFGAGLDREVTGLPRAMIEAMNGAGAPIVAVDLPSGINGTSGAVMGVAVKATHTVTFFRRKAGASAAAGASPLRHHRGRRHRYSGSVCSTPIKPATFANGPGLWGRVFPLPRPEGHKYARGHAVVVSGGMGTTGAARLAARGALRAGAGLVTLASPRDALAINAATSLAVMVRPVDGAAELADFLADRRHNAVVLGPGAGVGAGAARAGPSGARERRGGRARRRRADQLCR